MVLLAAVPVAFAAVTTFGMYDAFAKPGGRGVWSDGVYELERYVDRDHAQASVVAVDWGLAAELTTLTQGRVDADGIAVNLEDAADARTQDALVRAPARDRATWYVLRAPGASTATPKAQPRFMAAVARLHFRPKLVHVVDDLERRPAYEIYTITR
jgi:hypothetical protein